MDWKKAIRLRTSRRAYLPKSIHHRVVVRLKESVFQYNQESGLQIRLVENDAELFRHFTAGYGVFSGIQNYFAMIGRETDECLQEKVGYYGEKLVLEATAFGLGTCWIGGTYQKEPCRRRLRLREGETLVCIIAVGDVMTQRTLKEKVVRKVVRRNGKSLEDLCQGELPDSRAFLEGLEAVQRAPSARNKQPVQFSYDNGTVTASVANWEKNGVDFGIAMLHFELGSGSPHPFVYLHGKYQLELPL